MSRTVIGKFRRKSYGQSHLSRFGQRFDQRMRTTYRPRPDSKDVLPSYQDIVDGVVEAKPVRAQGWRGRKATKPDVVLTQPRQPMAITMLIIPLSSPNGFRNEVPPLFALMHGPNAANGMQYSWGMDGEPGHLILDPAWQRILDSLVALWGKGIGPETSN